MAIHTTSLQWGITCRTAYIYLSGLGYSFVFCREACRSNRLHNPFMSVSNPPSFFFAYRNNLTVIDAIMVQGQGTTESLKVAGKPPGPGSSLRFKITEALLKDCSESEYFMNYCAEQKINDILHVQLKICMCGNVFFPVLVCQNFLTF